VDAANPAYKVILVQTGRTAETGAGTRKNQLIPCFLSL
jgi:hypothetical protein